MEGNKFRERIREKEREGGGRVKRRKRKKKESIKNESFVYIEQARLHISVKDGSNLQLSLSRVFFFFSSFISVLQTIERKRGKKNS